MIKAILGMLRPLVRVLIRNEFVHAELTELVRQTYVEVAFDHYKIPGQEMTVSRAAVLTGLSRKEVVRLRKILDEEQSTPKPSPNRAQKVVHGWLSDKEFLDRKSQPRELPIKGDNGSFTALVRRYSGDITYGAVLDELNLVGVTCQPDEHTVKLVNHAYIPHKDELRSFQIMGSSVADLLKTAVHNIETQEEEKYFQRQVVYSGVDETLARKFRELSSQKALELIEEMNQYLSQERKKSRTRQIALGKETVQGRRVGLGIYYLQDPENPVSEKSDK